MTYFFSISRFSANNTKCLRNVMFMVVEATTKMNNAPKLYHFQIIPTDESERNHWIVAMPNEPSSLL